ncbi:TIGR02117 family protein [Sphingomonas sp.]|uniref:TIGR02117 family protein n=1 Tax=Sphingomonas sp. TaxID=28214 RepID=UPI0025F684F8|nr:TIGR02117 family protein [Sphingomonas sp.]
MIRILKRMGLGLLGLVLLYLGAGTVGGAIPVNHGWRSGDAGVRIYVIDNGIHTDLVLPMFAEPDGWSNLVRPQDFADSTTATATHLSFGWGDRDFYLNTPTWWDLNPIRVVKAMVGVGETVVHVERMYEPRPGRNVRAVTLRPEEYARLAAFIRATFGEGEPVRGYGGSDVFYPGTGNYNMFNTCNNWTGAGLRKAGVKMGIWTPFTFGVMKWL